LATTGTVARVAGVVVDAEFPSGDLPGIHDALIVQRDDGPKPVVVQTSEVWQTSEVLEDDRRFDRLARELLATLDAQPDGVLQVHGNKGDRRPDPIL
jgi:hypothetical protein